MESNQPSCANFYQFPRPSVVTLGSLTTRDHQRDPRTEEHMERGEGTYGNDFREMILISMFLLGKLINMYVKCNIMN